MGVEPAGELDRACHRPCSCSCSCPVFSCCGLRRCRPAWLGELSAADAGLSVEATGLEAEPSSFPQLLLLLPTSEEPSLRRGPLLRGEAISAADRGYCCSAPSCAIGPIHQQRTRTLADEMGAPSNAETTRNVHIVQQWAKLYRWQVETEAQ